jgi:thymidylate synthase (FAD)
MIQPQTIYDPLQDKKSSLQLIDFMGGELSIVNDARASFNKESQQLTDKDIKLIHYLIEHKHFSPLRSTVFKFKVRAPLFLARQWWKHVVASSHTEEQQSWNESSFRYIDFTDNCQFYIPLEFRQQSKNNKQGSDGVCPDSDKAKRIYENLCLQSKFAYQDLLSFGVCKEQARAVLVPSIYTTWVWTVSLQSLLNFIELRSGTDAQSEIQLYSNILQQIITPLVPNVVTAFNLK